MSYEPLFTPLKIGGVTIKNRIIMCAMGGTSPVGFDGKFVERPGHIFWPGPRPMWD